MIYYDIKYEDEMVIELGGEQEFFSLMVILRSKTNIWNIELEEES